MARILVIAMMSLAALVPPGFCACRVMGILIPTEESAPEHSEDGDDHDSCNCEALLPDAVAPKAVSVSVASHDLVSAVAPSAIAPQFNPIFVHPIFDPPPLYDRPLYLTLRALRI